MISAIAPSSLWCLRFIYNHQATTSHYWIKNQGSPCVHLFIASCHNKNIACHVLTFYLCSCAPPSRSLTNTSRHTYFTLAACPGILMSAKVYLAIHFSISLYLLFRTTASHSTPPVYWHPHMLCRETVREALWYCIPPVNAPIAVLLFNNCLKLVVHLVGAMSLSNKLVLDCFNRLRH